MIRSLPSRRLFLAGLALTSIALAASATAADLPTAEELFAKNAAALGGDALGKVENMAAEFTFSMPTMGLETTGEAYVEVPHKTYSMISLTAMGSSDFESGVNGDVAWQNNPQMGLRRLEGNERRMALRGGWLDPFAGWKDLWDRAETVAEETVGDATCYKVVLTPAEGSPLTAWFDEETGLLVQEELPVPEMGMSVVTTFGDYREVDGVKTAHRIDQEGPMPWTIQYTTVRFNTDDIPEGVFEVPQGIKAMAAE
jgi:outer membrane lipoprotein-sorting protein